MSTGGEAGSGAFKVGSLSYRRGTGNYTGALDDLRLVMTREPSVENYVAHGNLALAQGDISSALDDGEAALKLEPSSVEALGLVASAEAERGNLSRAISMIDEAIALGGENKPDLIVAKAGLIGEYGDPHDAIRLLDELLLERPGNPHILNEMCWIKGTHNFELETALKNCTSAIELSTSSAAILDSRAMVWFRMKRYDDALRDLDAALLQTPGQGPSRFLRSLVLQKLGRQDEATLELSLARRLAPGAERMYARFGLKP